MNEASAAGKPILIDDGRGHLDSKLVWVTAAWALILLVFRLHEQHGRRQFMVYNYWLWHDAPVISYATDIRLIVAAAVTISLAILTNVAIRKNEIRIYDDFCAGRAIRVWGLLPTARDFHLRYDEIVAVKVRKRTLHIRSTRGRYNVFVYCPQTCYDYITKISSKGE